MSAPHNGYSRLQIALHRIMSVLIFATPALGAMTWHGGFDDMGDLYESVGQVLIIVAIGHLVLVILHQLLWADGALARVFSRSRD